MTRTGEVEVLAATLEERERLPLHAAILAQGAGELGAAALQARAVARRGLDWPAFLLALEAAELALGGAVAIETPARWRTEGNLVTEEWGPFRARLFPSGAVLTLALKRDKRGRLSLEVDGRRGGDWPEHVLDVVAEVLADYLGKGVRLAA